MYEPLQRGRRHLIAASLALPLVAHAQGKGAQPVELRDYRPVMPAQRVDGNRIEVLEFFQYGCPHCYAFNADLERWKKTLPQIMNWGRFDMKNYMTIDDIDAWVRETRHKVMYRDEAKVD